MEKGIDSHDEYGAQKRTSFPCLATARYVVAAVVSVLTIVVVVMVIIVALRSEEVIFSIPQYIKADRPWWAVSSDDSMAPAVQTTGTATSTTTMTVPVIINSSFGGSTDPVEFFFIWVRLTADNPSGRADISGEIVTIRVIDMPYWSSSLSFQGLKEIVTYELQKDRFSLKRRTSHTLGKWIPVKNSTVMSYLACRYGGQTSFPVMVQVTATVTSATSIMGTGTKIYYCWPVFVALIEPSGGYSKMASCRPEKEMDSPVPPAVPPPALAPAPAPAPTAAAC